MVDDAAINAGPLGGRIREARVRAGLNQKDFGLHGGVSITTQQQYEAGKTAPTTDYLFRIRNLGVDIAELLTGVPSAPTFASSLRASLQESAKRESDGLVEVEEIDLTYGMGGTFADGPIMVRRHLLPQTFLSTITSTPASQLTLSRGVGDSMQPTLLDGDMILIDRSQRVVRDQDAIWALTVGDIAMVKRLRLRSGRMRMLSDNERVPPDEALLDELNIVGRVIFIGRRI